MGIRFENQRAFAPFFDDPVAVVAKRENGRVINTTVMACVLDQGLDDPLADGTVDSSRGRVSVSAKKSDCDAYGFRPQAGDRLTLADGRSFAVYSVSETGGWCYEMLAREAS